MKNRLKMSLLTAAAAVSLLMLSACEENDNSSGTKDTTTMTTRPRPQSYYYDEDQPEMLTVKPKSYTDGMLTYEYEGKEYTLPLEFSVINDPFNLNRPSVSERVIQNYRDDGFTAEIILDDKKENIIFFDILRCNGITQYSCSETPTLRRVSDTELELTDGGTAFRIDMNDMTTYYKGSIPLNTEIKASFFGYRMKGDRLIPLYLGLADSADSAEFNLTTEGMIAFCGTVQSITDKRAAVILNDDKTVCDVPCVLTDGELSVGQKVAVILDEDKSLYDSGRAYKGDYAVFVTLYKDYIPSTRKIEFEDCAYFKQSETDVYMREPVLKKKK